MAKNKKKKSSSKTPHSTLKLSISKTQFDTGCAVAQKMLHLMGFEPTLFNMFSKKQKHLLLDFEPPVPIIRIKSGNYVPRQYLNNMRTSTINFMKTKYVDEEIKLTYMELFTYGIPFIFAVKIKHDAGVFSEEQEKAFVEKMAEQFDSISTITESWFMKLFANIGFDLSYFSQVNFRTYGFGFTTDIPKPKELFGIATLRFIIELTSFENESIYFVHKNIKRKAFSVHLNSTLSHVPPPATMPHKNLYPGSKLTKRYRIYVQSHVIHRFKERIDIVDAQNRNHIICMSLTVYQKIIKGGNGCNLISCYVNGVSFGYFPFIIQGDKLFILSFLPFVSQITPEGEKLYRILNLSKDELVYLGMDKLSFYTMVDFDEIPVLKNALIESGIWKIKEELDNGVNGKFESDEVKTQFVKNFFLKTEDRRKQILSENETEIFDEWND